MSVVRRVRRFPNALTLAPSLMRQSSYNYSTARSPDSSNLPPLPTRPVIGILGAGISGLSTAFYLNKLYGDNVQTVLFEESNRVGGWMSTVKGKDGGFFEMGPRTIRPVGVKGLNTLDLVEEIGLDTEVLYIEKTHDVANNRFIFVDGELVRLPSDYTFLYKRIKPFSRPLVWALLRDVFTSKQPLPDDSIHNFVSRRFGKEIADYLTDPMIRGICSGDSRKISIKFLMKDLFELEQKYGSVVVGMLRQRFSKEKKKCSMSENDKDVGFSKIAAASLIGNWAVWGLERGIGSLPERIYERLSGDVQVKFGCRVEGLESTNSSGVRVKYSLDGKSDHVDCDHVVSSVGSHVLSGILKRSNGIVDNSVVDGLGNIEYQDLQVTGVRFNDDVLCYPGFGFLVPSFEKRAGGLLGVVFDTNCFPQGGDTVVTAMSRGEVGVGQDTETVVSDVKRCLGILVEPKEVVSSVLMKCIPQYTVGHYERVGKILGGFGATVSVCGAWVDGVSVNDCVYRGRVLAKHIGQRIVNRDEKVRVTV